MRIACLLVPALFAAHAAMADQVTVSGGSVYVTKSDCAQMVAHRPDADVGYKPGVDARGKYVAPADLPGSDYSNLVPSNGAAFNVVVNPMNYAQRNQAQSQVASSSQAVVNNSKTLQQAQAASTQLSSKLTSLQTTNQTLSTQKQQIDTSVATQTAQIVAATGGATPTPYQNTERQIQLNALASQTTNTTTYQKLASDLAANTAQISQTNAAIAQNSQTLAAAQAQSQPLQDQLTSSQGQAAGLQGKYDNTALPVAHVDVNLKTGETTINGRPLTPQQDAIVREACRKAGYR